MTAHKQTNGDGIARVARQPLRADVARIRDASELAIRLGGELVAIRRGVMAFPENGWTPGEIRGGGEHGTIEMEFTPPQRLVNALVAQPMVVRVNSEGEFFLGDGATFAPFPENTVGNNARRAIYVFNAIRALNDAATSILREFDEPLEANQA